MIKDLSLARRTFVAGLASSAVACTAPQLGRWPAAQVPIQSNPLVRQRADAQIFRDSDGSYYMTGSVPEYDRLMLRRARTLAGLASAEERVLWRHLAKGPLSGFIWAPELHRIDGRWIMYFAAGPSGGGEDVFRIRTHAIACDGADPMTGKWSVLGQFQAPWDSFNLDSTIFVHRGTRYFLWAQHEPGIDTNSNLYLAPLATPLTLARKPARLSVPTLDWEIQGFKVNEGPAVLNRNGRLFLTYSASATDARYALGMLTADEDADIMSPASWTKSPTPVFVTSPVTQVYGPGHNSFTVDEQGRDVLVYHARDYEKITGDPLYDPNRHTRVQRIYYRTDGTPDFGIPVGNGPVPDRFSPLDQRSEFLVLSGGRAVVGAGDLPSTQFRRVAGLMGGPSIGLEPILAAGQRLVRTDTGVAAGAADGSAEFAARSSFVALPGLADEAGMSFAAADAPSTYLQHVGGELRIAPVRNPAERASATFLVS